VCLLHLIVAASAVPAQQTLCPGDCSVDGDVRVNEIVTMIGVINGSIPPASCRAGDADGDGRVRSNDVTRAVRSLLGGCTAGARGQAAFYQTLAGVADRNEDVIALLGQAVEENPTDGWSWFLLGMNHLLRVGRVLTDYQNPSAATIEEARLARLALDAAVPLLTYDNRIPGFRGAATYLLGFLTDDPVTVGSGLAQLDDAIEVNLLFNSFSYLGTVAPSVAPDDPLFAQAIAYLEAALNSGCTPFTDPRNCGNEGRAPHNLQGSFLLFGDLFAKAGRVEQARGYYEFGLILPGIETWPFRAITEERLATIEQRAALYQDADPGNDPPIVGAGPEACVYCHVR
jgi:hypothetical protein